jgi:HK97 family phage prohead protease
MDDKRFLLAEVKTTGDEGEEFLAILSAPTLDRDKEIIDENAFAPLPESIPVHLYHDFSNPVGRAVPFYDEGVLKVRGFFASTDRAQEARTLVREGVIGSMSVGFMDAAREVGEDGVTHITKGEILEGSFVSVPSNREAAVLMAKEYVAKVGARNSAADGDRLQAAHDLIVEAGAKCAAPDEERGVDMAAMKERIERDVRKHGVMSLADIRRIEGLPEVPDTKTEGEENSTGMAPLDAARLAIARLEAGLLLED